MRGLPRPSLGHLTLSRSSGDRSRRRGECHLFLRAGNIAKTSGYPCGLRLLEGAFWLGVSPFYVIVGAAILAIIIFKTEAAQAPAGARAAASLPITHIVALLLAVVIGLFCLYLTSTKLLTLALLMLKIDLFAFGGGFASLPLMLQQIVHVQGWMDERTFMDGIALGQITPGPICDHGKFCRVPSAWVAGRRGCNYRYFHPVIRSARDNGALF